MPSQKLPKCKRRGLRKKRKGKRPKQLTAKGLRQISAIVDNFLIGIEKGTENS